MAETACASGLMKVRQCAEFLACSRGHVYELMKNGSLPWVSWGNDRRIPVASVLEFCDQHCRRSAGKGDR